MQYTLATMLAASAMMPSAMAHYVFNSLVVDGVATTEYEYVRKNTNINSPVTDVTSEDMRCNVGTQASAATTKTHPVAAGSEVGFTVVSEIGHPGPLMVYMSKAPGDVSEYDGSGDWFKIYELGVAQFATESTALSWVTDHAKNVTIPIPTAIEDGQYLLRVEHLGVHGSQALDGGQFYISCAQIEVTGGSGGSPSPLVKIPGVYSNTDPGIYFNPYYPPVTNYTIPGPAVYGGGESSTPAPVTTGAASLPTSAPNSTASGIAAPTTLVTLTRAASSTVAAETPVPTTVDDEEDDCE